VNPIRPANLPVTPAPTQGSGGADAARAAAQRAFFDAAMGRAPAAASSQITTAPAVPQRVEPRPSAAAEAPTRILRPGSLLDIRI
jgi:hypothetical protein